jgi:hypothetical protein
VPAGATPAGSAANGDLLIWPTILDSVDSVTNAVAVLLPFE